MFRSIKTKIMVLQTGLVISVAAALGFNAYLIMFHSLRDSQRQNLEYMAKSIGEGLSLSIDDKK
jgi:sensor domain CHASE-containing protein